MARHSTPDPSSILKAAKQWKDSCLLKDGSVFSESPIWTTENLAHFKECYVDNPDESKNSFIVKFERQLETATSDVKRLAAEIDWVYFLFPKNTISFSKKIAEIEKIWSWSGEHLAKDHPMLKAFSEGIGHPGTAYMTQKWREILYIWQVVTEFKKLNSDTRRQHLEDPWKFSSWLESVKGSDRRQMRHVFCYLLFPDFFERIASHGHKELIYNAFSKKYDAQNSNNQAYENAPPHTRLDWRILQIRNELEQERGNIAFDFYQDTEIEKLWHPNHSKDNNPVSLAEGSGPKDGSFHDITSKVKREHVITALQDIDRDGIPERAQSNTYDLIYGTKHYPPKLALSWAVKHASGHEYNRSSFSGGEESQCFKLLRELGFWIENKKAIQDLLKKFLEQADGGTDLTTKDYSAKYRGLKVKVSFGQGVFARIPWISFLKEGQTTSNGYYPCFLYYKSSQLLILGKAISETNKSEESWAINNNDVTIADLFKGRNIARPDRYGQSFVYKNYELKNGLNLDAFAQDLDSLIAEYRPEEKEPETITDRINEDAIDKIQIATALASSQQVLTSYKQCVQKSGFKFDDTLLDGFLAAIISKPFTILTGASGTGKTKIAELLTKHLSDEAKSSYAVVPVGADWTDNRNVLGFVNHLRDDGSGTKQPIFQSTEVLNLLLNADQNPDYPHFLILDEMNLSHVERYFSDFLSVMEQNDGELKLHSEGDRKLRRFKDDAVKVPQALAYPKNLFVIGTVNIDETTYMFSPKVLDRANVIEFTVSAEDIGAFLAEPKAYQEIEQAEEGIAEGLLDLARKAQDSDWEQLPSAPAKLIADHLLNLFKILKDGRFEFAYRTAKEVNTYLRVCRHLSEDATAWDGGEWAKNLDDQVLQKLLPKLHGSMGRIGNLLASLASYCHSGEYKAPENHSGASQQNQSRNQLEEASKLIVEDAKFPRSLEKLQAMIHTLRDEQFVSFIQ